MFGIIANIPHRQYLGESGSATGAPTVFRWQAQHTLLERGASDVMIAVPDLQRAGLPVLDEGVGLDFEGGLYEDDLFDQPGFAALVAAGSGSG